MAERIYNGIELPEVFPPDGMEQIGGYDQLPVPYLNKKPDVIDISIGRQLFVDDFLIEHSTFVRQYHKPVKYAKNPIFFPETEMEKGMFGNVAMAAPFSDGVWVDEGKFKMWYHAGWFDGTAYAESSDGFNWERINFKDGSNRVILIRDGVMRDSCAVVVDNYHQNAENKYKMFLFVRPGGGELYESADGMNWKFVSKTGALGDRSTMFYNPFRKKWVYSIRSEFGPNYPVRARKYKEADTLLQGADLSGSVFWCRADRYDPCRPEIGNKPTLYNLDAVAYESVMLGAFCVFLGPENDIASNLGIPKHTHLSMSYSRDGFHWFRGDRSAFIEPERDNPDSWERGYIHSNNAICLINGDELWFYYTAFKGNEAMTNRAIQSDGIYANASTGLAKLRRDGFASLNCFGYKAELVTERLAFSGEYLFVNADFHQGELRVAILGEQGKVIPGFDLDDCVVMSENSTKHKIKCKHGRTLKELQGRNIKLKFEGQNGLLYSFWITDDSFGKSHGYLAGGEVGKTSYIDE